MNWAVQEHDYPVKGLAQRHRRLICVCGHYRLSHHKVNGALKCDYCKNPCNKFKLDRNKKNA